MTDGSVHITHLTSPRMTLSQLSSFHRKPDELRCKAILFAVAATTNSTLSSDDMRSVEMRWCERGDMMNWWRWCALCGCCDWRPTTVRVHRTLPSLTNYSTSAGATRSCLHYVTRASLVVPDLPQPCPMLLLLLLLFQRWVSLPACRSLRQSVVVILNFKISQGSVVTLFSWGEILYGRYLDSSFLENL